MIKSELLTPSFNDLIILCKMIYYSMQYYDKQEDDLEPLQDLIFMISKELTNNNDFLLSMDGSETINAWQIPAKEALIILQLTHFQTVWYLTKNCLDSQALGKRDSTIETILSKMLSKYV